MSLEKFKKGCFVYYDEQSNKGLLLDENNKELLNFSFSDDNERYNLSLYINNQKYSLDDIEKAKIDLHMKQMLIFYFEIKQNELDILDPSLNLDQYEEPPCSYGGRI